ncbi:MAG: hypothetical protein ACREP3_16330, partial [Candidatus Binatia bacterium]
MAHRFVALADHSVKQAGAVDAFTLLRRNEESENTGWDQILGEVIVKTLISLILVFGLFPRADFGFAADRVRFAYPAKSLNYLPITMGREKGIFHAEGIDLQMVLVASTIQVTALTTGDIDFSGAQSQVMAGAARGLP